MPIIGEIRAFAFGSTASLKELEKDGWLECDGRAIDAQTFKELAKRIGKPDFPWGSPDQSIGAYYLPDLRGMFLRGWQHQRTSGGDPDNGFRSRGGVTVGNQVGSVQASSNLSHFHDKLFAPSMPDKLVRFAMASTAGGSEFTVKDVSSDPVRTSDSGGNESRPVNAYVTFCIYAGKKTLD